MAVKLVVFRDGETVVSSGVVCPRCSEGGEPILHHVFDRDNDGRPDTVFYNCPNKMKITVPEDLPNKRFWGASAITEEDIAKAKPVLDEGKKEAMQVYTDLQKALKDETVYNKEVIFNGITMETYLCFKDSSAREVKVQLETREGYNEVWRIRLYREDRFEVVIDDPKMIAELGDLRDILDRQKKLPR